MAQLEDCYFCGTVGRSLESYPVIPPETDPPGDTQRTVVVCPTCSAKLDRVLDPVVKHFESADRTESGPESTTDAGDDGVDPPDTGTVNLGIGSDATEREEQPAEGDEEPATVEPEAEQEETPDAGDGQEGADAEDGQEGTDAPADARKQVEFPEETRDIVRLLRNREFPVEREEIVAVAANAYEIRYEDCETAIDALIAAGHLDERDGELYRGE